MTAPLSNPWWFFEVPIVIAPVFLRQGKLLVVEQQRHAPAVYLQRVHLSSPAARVRGDTSDRHTAV